MRTARAPRRSLLPPSPSTSRLAESSLAERDPLLGPQQQGAEAEASLEVVVAAASGATEDTGEAEAGGVEAGGDGCRIGLTASPACAFDSLLRYMYSRFLLYT